MAVPRQFEFMVVVSMVVPPVQGGGRKRLGIDADWADGKSLFVKSVMSGAVEDWNKDHHGADDCVRSGDRIVAVNGVAGDAQAMVQECKEKLMLQLLVRRIIDSSPPPPPPAWPSGQHAPTNATDMLLHMRHQQAARENAAARGQQQTEARPKIATGYEPPDYYGILGAASNADETEVKRCYRKLVLLWHPDKHPQDREQADVKIRQINNAYETLSNPSKRSTYDQMLQAMERRRTGARLDISFIKPRMAIPKEFMLCPLGHPDKFVRVLGEDELRIQARDEVPGVGFRDFFAAARFSLWWLPEVNNMCRLRAQSTAAQGVEGGIHLSFGQSGVFADQRESSVALSGTQDVKAANLIVQASPFSAGAFRFEGAYWPGRFLVFRPPASLLMAKAVDEGGDEIVDFMLVDYTAAYKYMTMTEVLAEAVEKQIAGNPEAFVKLGDLRADLNIRLYFQQNLGSAVWNNKDFETFFEGHYEQWDFDQKRARVRLRPKEEQHAQKQSRAAAAPEPPAATGAARSGGPRGSADVLLVAETQAEVVKASLLASSQDVATTIAPAAVLRALQRLAESPRQGVDLRELAQARLRLLGALPLLCDRAAAENGLGTDSMPFPTLASLHRAAAAITADFLSGEGGGEVRTAAIRGSEQLAALAGKRVARDPGGVDWDRLAELLAMPLDWEAVAEPLSNALSSHLRRANEQPGAFISAIRSLSAAGKRARSIAEELAKYEFGGLQNADGQVAAEVLLAVADSPASSREVAERLRPPLLHRLPLPELVELVAMLGERGYGEKIRPALQTRVAVAGPALAAVPPGRLLRLAGAATRCPVIAECALGPVAIAAASALQIWPLEGVPEMMLIAATSTTPSASSGTRRFLARAAELVSPRLHELSPSQLLRTVVAAGVAGAQCRSLLESSSESATAHLDAFTPDQVFLITQGSLTLGGCHPAMVRLLDFWVVYFEVLAQQTAEGQLDLGLPADDIAQLVRLLAVVSPNQLEIFTSACSRLRKVVSQLSSTGRSAVLEAFPGGTGPAFRGKEELLAAVVAAEASSEDARAAGKNAEEAILAEMAAAAEETAQRSRRKEASRSRSHRREESPKRRSRSRKHRSKSRHDRSRSRSGKRRKDDEHGESAKPHPEDKEKRGKSRKRSRDRDKRRRRDDEDGERHKAESIRMVE